MFDSVLQYALYLRDQTFCMVGLLVASFFSELHPVLEDLSGKTAIVTGANSGLGYSIALGLAKQNAKVYLACRNLTKANEAAERIKFETNSKHVHVVELDTSSLESVRSFAASWTQPINILVHNAGIATTTTTKVTKEGLGLIYATNHAGAFLLTSLLESKLASQARVILTSSAGQYGGRADAIFREPRLIPDKEVADFVRYGDTKFMQVAFAKTLQKRWHSRGEDFIVHAFNPGFAVTPIFDKVPVSARLTDPVFYLLKIGTGLAISSEEGAKTGLWLASTNEPAVLQGGQFWDRCVRRVTKADLLGNGTLERMWQLWTLDTGAEWSS